jgi:periplasmic protein TonB
MTQDFADKYTPSANVMFKAQYQKTLRLSVLLAILVTIIAFIISPEIKFKPYVLRTEELEIVDLEEPPDVIDLPPPPPAPPPPPRVIEAAPDDAFLEDVDIADTFIDFDQALDHGMESWDPTSTDDFVISMEKPTLRPGGYVAPEYPEIARLSQMQGTVIVKVLVGPDGSVLDAQIIQSVHPLLDREALRAARQTRWNPGRQRDNPVQAWMALPYNFTLR